MPALGSARALVSSALAFLGVREQPGETNAVPCPPQSWVLGEFGSGHWILDHTDATWGWYMEFLNVSKDNYPDEFNCSDIHQYIFTDRGTFIMNHTIPKTNFHLMFEAGIAGKWEKNPYPAVTPAGFDKHAKVNLTSWRNSIDAGPLGTSCSAIKTDMPVTKINATTGEYDEFVVTFWRELTNPTFMKASLYVTTTEGDVIEPWKSKGFSHRFFRKTVQSYDDAAKRLECVPSGFEEGANFC